MPDSYTRQVVRVQRSLEAPNRRAILSAARDLGLIEIRKVWAYPRFKYEGIRPKPSFSKSERGWKGYIDDGTLPALIFANPTVDKYGRNYPKYVHLSGVRSLLMLEVVAVIAKRAASTGRALAHDRLKAARMVTYGA